MEFGIGSLGAPKGAGSLAETKLGASDTKLWSKYSGSFFLCNRDINYVEIHSLIGIQDLSSSVDQIGISRQPE